jgi:hypothetical protein
MAGRYFREMGQPIGEMSLPSGQLTYAQSDLQHAMAVAKKYGVKILTPEETRDALPKYRGLLRTDRNDVSGGPPEAAA